MDCSSIDEHMETLFDLYREFDAETLERVRQRPFKVYNLILHALGDNDLT